MHNFLLLRELIENALCRIFVAMAELSFVEPTRSSRCIRGGLSSVYLQPQVGLRRRKVKLHAHSREGPDDCRWQQVNCASFLPSSKAFVSLLISWEPYSAIFLKACWFRYSNRSKKGPQSCMDTFSQILPSIVMFLVWRKLRSVRKRTKQLCLVGGHFYFGTKGCARNSKLRP